jgi:hypothetical protein
LDPEAIAKLKALIRAAEPHDVKTLWDNIGDVPRALLLAGVLQPSGQFWISTDNVRSI